MKPSKSLRAVRNVLVCALLIAGSRELPLVSSAFGADLMSPFDFENTAVLPKGVRNPRFKNIVEFMDERYSGTGGSEPLGYLLNKPVTWQDVIDGQDDAQLKTLVQGELAKLGANQPGFSMADLAGATSGIANIYMNAKVPVLGMGVTDKLTLAVAVPIVSIQVNADTGITHTPAGQALITDVCTNQPDQCAKATNDLNNAVNTKLKRLGYNPIHSYTQTNIGDVKFVGKYQLWSDYDDGLALKGEVVAPTGVAPNADNALDTPTGDGAWDVGATVIYDRYLNHAKTFRANANLGYQVNLADHIEKRLPLNDHDSLSGDKELLARDRGDLVHANVSLAYELPFGLNFAAGYAYQHQNGTSYQGTSPDSYRYHLLEALAPNASESLHSAILGLGYSTVEMYKNHQFVLPFQLNAAYSKPIAGMNVVKNELMEFEIVLFF